MKFFIVLSAVVLFAAAELYSSENDNLDIDGVLADPETRKAFMNCFNDKGSCDERMADFKKDLAEAIAQACAKCTDAQKHILKRFLEVTKVKDSEEFQIFKQKYDPQDKFITPLESAIANA